MSLLTSLIVKNSYILVGIYFIFLRKRPRSNFKPLQYQIVTLVEGSEKLVIKRDKFSRLLQISCSNFRLKLCERP